MLFLTKLMLSLGISSSFSLSPHTFHRSRNRVSRPSLLQLSLLDNIFGSKDDINKKKSDDGELASFLKFPANQYDGLSEYVRQWAMLFETEGGLTTPVKVLASDQGAKILFKPKESTYRSKKEEDDKESGNDNKKKKEPNKEGGVEIAVQMDDGGEVNVLARRCEMDEGTMIREMSEQAIVDGLKKAITVWKKDHAT